MRNDPQGHIHLFNIHLFNKLGGAIDAPMS
jgi:hypothetical protein